MNVLLWVAIGFAALLVLILIRAFNRLAALRHRAANARHQVEVQLARRHDLIPNLVELVKASLAHERGTLEALAGARRDAMTALKVGAASQESVAAEDRLSSLLGTAMSLVEAQPELRALRNVHALHEELSSTENRIAFARQHYNDAASDYNAGREQFPANLFAGGGEPVPLWEMPEGSGAVPRVDLTSGLAAG